MTDNDTIYDDDEIDTFEDDDVIGGDDGVDFSEDWMPEGFYRLRVKTVKVDRTQPNDKYPVSAENPRGGQDRVGLFLEVESAEPEWNGTKFWVNFYLGNKYGRRDFNAMYLFATGVNLQANKSAKPKKSLLQGTEDAPVVLYGYVKHDSQEHETEGPDGETQKVKIVSGYSVNRWAKLPKITDEDYATADSYGDPV